MYPKWTEGYSVKLASAPDPAAERTEKNVLREQKKIMASLIEECSKSKTPKGVWVNVNSVP